MKKLHFNIKIIIIFLLPSMVLVYLLFIFMTNKYAELQESSIIKISTEVTGVLSKLIHNVQLERGLSSGYITNKISSSHKALLQQRENTDTAYKNLLYFINLNSDAKTLLYERVSYRIEPIMKDIIKDFNKITLVRERIINASIDFNTEVNYYTNIDIKIIKAIKVISHISNRENTNSLTIEILHYLKENAGLERAYVYNQLLCLTYDKHSIDKIETFQKNQLLNEEEFSIIASKQALQYYEKNINIQANKELNIFREKFIKHKLNQVDAKAWFDLSTAYIDKIDAVLLKIFSSYIEDAKKGENEAQTELSLAILFGVVAYVSLVIMLLLLKNLIKKEDDLVKDLRFAAHAFESHEAMTITDVDGVIIKINKAFTEITGYSKDEAIGTNPSILKSGLHDDSFYEDMWKKINTDGKWNGEIYNKRKNGAVYPELLSITAIKDTTGETTHYIAQFLDISELKEAQEKALHQANHDFLTGLMNRKAITLRLEEEFSKATRHNFLEAFLFIDLDDFKYINDNYGHNVGDLVLIEFSARLKRTLRKEDLVARLSGDEFAIIITNANANKEKLLSTTKFLCDKIFKAVNENFIIGEHTLQIGISIGVSFFPLNQKDIDEVVHHGDLAMYKAKKSGKNRVEFYEEEAN